MELMLESFVKIVQPY